MRTLRACFMLLAALALAPATASAQFWTATTPYPGGNFSAGSCVADHGVIYCVGGTNDSRVWSAPLAAGGIGTWQQTTSYGEGGSNIFLSCAVSDGYIYCVGGSNLGGDSNDVTSHVWYAPISGGAVGTWQAGTAYGIPAAPIVQNKVAGDDIWGQSCVANNHNLYCIGGLERTYQIIPTQNGAVTVPIDNQSAKVYYAPVDASGVGLWRAATDYPDHITGESCVTDDGYVYCVAGSSGNSVSSSDTSDVYYAQFQSDGTLGAWNQTTSYGGGGVEGLSCTVLLGQIHCSGGNSQDAWTASLSPFGVGTWARENLYPEATWEPSCVSSGARVYCVGGGQGGGDTTTEFLLPTSTITIDSADTCGVLNGDWSSSNATCTLTTVTTIDSALTIKIPAGVTVTLSSDLSGLVNDGTIQNAGTLSSIGDAAAMNNGAITNTGTLQTGGTFTNAGSIQNSGTMESGGKFENDGTIYQDIGVTGHWTIDAGAAATTTGTIYADDTSIANLGTMTIVLNANTCTGEGNAAIGENFPFVIYGTWNAGTCTIGYIEGTSQPLGIPANVVLQIPAGTRLVTQGFFDIYGEVDNAGQLTNQAVSNGSGGYVLNTGFLTVHNKLVNTGTLTNQNGGSLGVSAGGELDNTGTLDNPETGGLFNGGTLNNSSTLNNGGGIYDYATINNSGTITNTGVINTQLTVTASIVNSGTGSIVNQNGGTTNGRGGTITGTVGTPPVTLDATGCPAIGGTWNADANVCLIGKTAVTIGASTMLVIPAGAELINFGSLSVLGEIEVRGTLVNGSGLSISNGAGGTQGTIVVDAGGALMNFASLVVDTTLTNAGTFTNGVGGDFEMRAAFTNAGVMSNYGTLDNLGAIANNGTIANFCAGTVQQPPFASLTGNPIATGTCGALPLEPTVVSLTNDPDSTSVGQNVTLTATLWSDQATGTVTFFDGATSLGDVAVNSGFATLATSSIGIGDRAITARYSGDATHAAATSPAVAQTVSAQGSQPISLVARDFDGDGIADLAVVNAGSDTMAIFHGKGDGTFALAHAYPTVHSPDFVAAADLNGDGRLDLAISAYLGGGVTILLGNGDGTFTAAALAQPTTLASMVAVADVNQDGRPDLLLDKDLSGMTVFLGNGDGTFQAPTTVSVPYAHRLAVADFDGDGRPDVVFAQQLGINQVSVVLDKGDGTFGAPTVTNDSSFSGPQAIAADDLNGDGHPDLVVGNGNGFANNTSLSVLLGNGDGTFQPAKTFGGDRGPTAIDIADVNGDGRPDIVAAYNDGTLDVLPGNGDGTFKAPVAFTVGSDPSSIAVGDFNGNGHLDLATADVVGNDISILLDVAGAPDLSVAHTHSGSFTQGQQSAHYTIVVTNAGSGATSGTVSVVETLPAGLSLAGLSGDGWTCSLSAAACQRSDALPAGQSYPQIVVAVNVHADAPATVTPSATVSGGGDTTPSNDTAADPTTVVTLPTLTVTANGASRVYGAPDPAFTGTVAGLQNGDVITATYASSATSASGVGVYPIAPTLVDPNGLASHYRVVLVSGTLTITPAALVVTAASATRPFGTPNPSLGASFNGFQGADTAAALGGALAVTTGATAASAPGTYPTMASGVTSSNYTISFVPGVLTVTDVPPSAQADSATTLEDEAVSIPVLANDTDLETAALGAPLFITSVSAPVHGSAAADGSAIVYTPANGFSGADRFSYTIADAFGGSATADVAVTVTPDRLRHLVAFSVDSTTLREGVTVASGDIGANQPRIERRDDRHAANDVDVDDATVDIGEGATMQQPGSRVVGDVVRLDRRATVQDVVDNHLLNRRATILGVESHPLTTPYVALPAFPSIAAGTSDVRVRRREALTLAAGGYRRVRVGAGATLVLTGGLYQLASLDVEEGATVRFGAATELRILTTLDADARARLVLDSSAPGLSAADVVIYVGGGNDADHHVRRDRGDEDEFGGPAVARVGAAGVVQANIYAPNGTLSFAERVQATGAFIGGRVRVGVHATLALDSAFK